MQLSIISYFSIFFKKIQNYITNKYKLKTEVFEKKNDMYIQC